MEFAQYFFSLDYIVGIITFAAELTALKKKKHENIVIFIKL